MNFPAFDGFAALFLIGVALVHADNAAVAAGNMVEQGLGDVNGRANTPLGWHLQNGLEALFP